MFLTYIFIHSIYFYYVLSNNAMCALCAWATMVCQFYSFIATKHTMCTTCACVLVCIYWHEFLSTSITRFAAWSLVNWISSLIFVQIIMMNQNRYRTIWRWQTHNWWHIYRYDNIYIYIIVCRRWNQLNGTCFFSVLFYICMYTVYIYIITIRYSSIEII